MVCGNGDDGVNGESGCTRAGGENGKGGVSGTDGVNGCFVGVLELVVRMEKEE